MFKSALLRHGAAKGGTRIFAVVASAAFVAGCATSLPRSVQVYSGGDDGLSNHLVEALNKKIATSALTSVESAESAVLHIFFVSNARWEEVGPDIKVMYTVRFVGPVHARRSMISGSCMEKNMEVCADQIIKAARASLK